VPGLIDIHTHAGRSKEGPPMCLQDGVTGWVDAGSGGADNMDAIAAVARGAPQIGRCLINIARTGVAPGGELHDLTRATWTSRAARSHAIATSSLVSRDACRTTCAGANDLEALARAHRRQPTVLPVMIHVGQNYSPLRSYLSLLKRGDIVTHIYAPAPNGLLDDKGKLIPDVMQARRRGILFDFGNGVADHFDGQRCEAATKQDFWPDTFSTDWNTMSRTTGVVDMPNVMSKLLMFGMPLSAVIAASTVNARAHFPSIRRPRHAQRRRARRRGSPGVARR
jgi:dihydroorotase